MDSGYRSKLHSYVADYQSQNAPSDQASNWVQMINGMIFLIFP